MNPIQLGWLAAILTGILWGVTPVAGIPMLKVVDSKTIVWLQYVLATITLYLILSIQGLSREKTDKHQLKISWENRRDIFFTAICGFVGQGLYNYFSYLSLEKIAASENGIIQGLIPIVILMIGFIKHDAYFTLKQIIAAIGAFLGVFVLVLDPQSNSTGFSWGHLLCLASVLCFSSNAYLRVYLARKYGALRTMAHQFCFASIGFSLFLIYTGTDFTNILKLVESKQCLFAICLQGIGVSALSYLVYIYAMKRIGVDGAGMALNLTPLSSFILAVLILGEQVTILRILAIFMVISSMMLFIRFTPKSSKRYQHSATYLANVQTGMSNR
jgi:drug/metabolite transporter (DMT)-like permease